MHWCAGVVYWCRVLLLDSPTPFQCRLMHPGFCCSAALPVCVRRKLLLTLCVLLPSRALLLGGGPSKKQGAEEGSAQGGGKSWGAEEADDEGDEEEEEEAPGNGPERGIGAHVKRRDGMEMEVTFVSGEKCIDGS